MKQFLLIAAAALLSIPSWAQGTLHITFDGLPFQPVGTGYSYQSYYESGMIFTPIDPDAPFAGFGRTKGGGQLAGLVPDNGTAYLQAAGGDSLKFRFLNDSLFGISSVELAGYSYVVPDVTAYFAGYKPDGSTVTTNFVGSRLVFQPFYFGPEFNNLTRVEMPDFGSLDNLVISIPEPCTAGFVALGACFLGLRLLRPGSQGHREGA